MSKTFDAKLKMPFKDAIDHVKEKLAEEGFGIVTEIDVANTLQQKLDITFKNYSILGACNPVFAHRALKANDNVGLLLPCNVILFSNEEGTVTVSSMKPTHMLSILDSSEVCKVGAEAEEALERAFNKLV